MVKPTVTIGIPAYNEEGNIKKLLTSLLEQKTTLWRLDKVIVVSDSSTDRTNYLVKSIKNRKIKLFVNRNRRGQTYSQNKIIKNSQSDILVLLNADVLPYNRNLVDHLIKPFYTNKNLGMVSGDTVSRMPKTMFEKIIIHGREIRKNIYRSINDGKNIYLCHGRVRAISKSFYKHFRFENTVPEDAFSFLKSKQLGFEFLYVPEAKIIFRSPSNLSEHLKQSYRFNRGKNTLKNLFDVKMLRKEYKIPATLLFRNLLLAFAANPIMTMSYVFIHVYSKFSSKLQVERNQFSLWEVSTSSKKI